MAVFITNRLFRSKEEATSLSKSWTRLYGFYNSIRTIAIRSVSGHTSDIKLSNDRFISSQPHPREEMRGQ